MANENLDLNFKKFALALVLTFAVIFSAAWVWVIEEPMAYLDRDYAIWQAKKTMIHEGQVGSLVILGDSSAMVALIPARLGPGVVNLALPAGTPIDIFYLAKRVISVASPPKAVIISLSPSDVTDSPFFWKNSVGNSILSARETEEVREKSRELKDDRLVGGESPCDVDARLKLFLYAIKFPSFYCPALIQSRLDQRYADNVHEFSLLISTRGQGYFGVAHRATEPDHEVTLKAFVPSKLLDDYLDRSLALFQSHNLPVYFIGIPHNAASVPFYLPGLKEAFVQYLDHYASRYPNFHLLGDSFPISPPEDFGDPWHLNESAAPRWSDHVRQMLIDAHVAGGPFTPN